MLFFVFYPLQYQMIVGMTKPSANIEAANKKVVSYQANQGIGIWCSFFPSSKHLRGYLFHVLEERCAEIQIKYLFVYMKCS